MPTNHVFIDTNILLSFYHYTSDDAEQLKIIVKLVQNNGLVLYLTEQVADEFNRNRESKVSAAIKDLEKWGKAPGIPRSMINYAEAKAYQAAVSSVEKARSALIEQARKDAMARTLSADSLVADILKVATIIKRTDADISMAMARKAVGNPPGKKDSLGDQINWECLLRGVPAGTELHVVSKDGDFSSTLFTGAPHQFLLDEWVGKNNAQLHLHEELRPFLKAKYPGIQLATDVEKADAIQRLESSTNFQMTHSAIAALAPLSGTMTWGDADRVFTAGLINNQIGWIGTDEDVHAFYSNLMETFSSKLDPDLKAALLELFHAK